MTKIKASLPAWQKEINALEVELKYAVTEEGNLGVEGVEDAIKKLRMHVEAISRGSSGDQQIVVEILGQEIKIAVRPIKNEKDQKSIKHYEEYLDTASLNGKIPVSLWRAGYEKTVNMSIGGAKWEGTAIEVLRELVLLQELGESYKITELMLAGEVPEEILQRAAILNTG
jgi:hypothetical protein